MSKTTACALLALGFLLMLHGASAGTKNELFFEVTLRNLDHNIFCGGAILSRTWVLTTAGCVHNRAANDIYVRVGSNHEFNGGFTYTVKKVILHENFNSKTKENDIALLQINGPMTVSDDAKIEQLDDNVFGTNFNVTISGFTRVINEFRKEEATIVGNIECVKKFGPQYQNHSISCNSMCAQIDEGACTFYRGNPLTSKTGIVGVLSEGPCGRRIADVYTRTLPYYPWIKKKTGI